MIKEMDLEPGQESLRFKEPYEYANHREIDVRIGKILTVCYELQAQSKKSHLSHFVGVVLGNWLSFYDPDEAFPPDRIMACA